MAVTATVIHHRTTCSLPRRRNSTPATTIRRGPFPVRHLTTTTSSRSHPAAPRPSDTLDRVLSDLEAQPRLLTPSLLSTLLSAIPRHPTPRRRLARLRRLIAAPLLRRHGDLAVRLLHLHASLGLVAYAHHLFDHLLPARAREEDALPWNCLVAGYARVGRHHDALAIYLQMDEHGVPRDAITFACALQACAGAGSLALGQAIHRDAVRAGLASDARVCRALLDMYAQCGDMRRAQQVFDAMPVKDASSWNIMLVGCLRHGLWPHSVDTWRRMFREGHKPGSVALSTMLQLLTSSPLSSNDDHDKCKWGLEIHAWAIRHGLDTDLSLANALIGMYSEKYCQLGHALSVFESMPLRDRSSWNAIISAHRNDYGVLMMLRRMVDSGVQPDERTFAMLLSACNNLGLVEGGKRLFSEMENVYRVQPTLEHCACMVNMLGKAGMVHEAYEFVFKRKSLGNEPTVLKDLLRACSVHGNFRITDIVAKRLLDLEPDNESSFVLLMLTYQRAGRLEDIEWVKKMMTNRGL